MSSSTLKTELQDQMKHAMRAKEKERLGVIRLMLSAIKQIEVDERKTLENNDILILLDKMIKQRNDAIKQFETAKRDDLIQQELFEIDIIKQFLPEPLSEAELTALITQAMEQIQPEGIKDMGKVIGALRGQVQGRADMGQVSNMIKLALTQQS